MKWGDQIYNQLNVSMARGWGLTRIHMCRLGLWSSKRNPEGYKDFFI